MTVKPASPAPPRKDSYLQSLEKGLAVLNAFSIGDAELTISEIAVKTGQDRASARRAILTLTHLGYTRLKGRRFSLTPRVLSLSYHYLAALPFSAAAQPVIEELSDEVDETVSIGVLDRPDVVFAFRVPAKRYLTFDPSIGSRQPAHLHSIGHVLLAAMPDDELDAFVGGIDYANKRTPFSVGSKMALKKQLLAAREQGWAFTAQQYEENYCGIAVPLLDAAGEPVAALNVSFVMDRDAERRAAEDILPRLKLAARRIQRPGI